jgi:acetyl-CoA acyltransferase 1
MERLSTISKHLGTNKVSAKNAPKSPNDVVICGAVRTPLTKAKRGALKDTTPEILVKAALEGLVKKTGVKPEDIQDLVFGNVSQAGAGVFPVRMASLLAGLPDTVPCVSMNRLCSSGLEACATIASKIRAGFIDIGVGGGVEQMTMFDMQAGLDPEKISDSVFDHPHARNTLLSMGQTSENVAEKWGISREKQDRLAVESHRKAFEAQKNGLYDDEIVPVKTISKDADGKITEITVTKDDGIRKETTFEGLQKLKPAFKKDGTTTAGNSSQVTDGAAAVLLARRSTAEKLGLPILGRFIQYAVVGVPPEVMGIGPAVAIPEVLKKAGLELKDIDIIELNEAFASQATYCIEKLGIDVKKLNPKGGAIALGHPLGCTGARQIATILPELKRTGGKFGLISMCIGTGMGAAAVIERE